LLGARPAPAQQPDGVEVQTRGPIHEGYANPVDGKPTESMLIERQPPEAIEEVPPDQKPAGDNVQWIPGYWAWDEARNDFIWVSGFWRVPPPGRSWVPGSWRQVASGWQWVAGYWAAPEQPQEYLPPPPASLEAGPAVPAPSDDHVYVPGSWVYSGYRYVWRPGVWVVHRPGWVWIPAHFRWTPVGYVYVEGYWDYTLRDRGILFAPCWIDRRVAYRPGWYYAPSVVVYDDWLYGAMFVRAGSPHYYFGDYFEARYTSLGYHSWFSVSFSVGFRYDPLFSYYSVQYRRDPYWAPAIRDVYAARYAGDLPRPPVTIVQNNVVNNVTVINNPTIINKYPNINKTTNITNVTNVTNIAAPITKITNNNTNVVNNNNVNSNNRTMALTTINSTQKQQFIQSSKQIQSVGIQRVKAETALAAQGPAPAKQGEAPRVAKLDLPKPVIPVSGLGAAANAKLPPPPPVAHKAATTGTTGSHPVTGNANTNTPKTGGSNPVLGTPQGTNLPKTGTGNPPPKGVIGNPPPPKDKDKDKGPPPKGTDKNAPKDKEKGPGAFQPLSSGTTPHGSERTSPPSILPRLPTGPMHPPSDKDKDKDKKKSNDR
jgi:hypothetical protein